MNPTWPELFSAASGAVFSPCNKYRYALWRKWDEHRAPLVFVMLNPSTADAKDDDKTISMCSLFARREQAGGIIAVNLFAYKSTDWTGLLQISDRIGPENASWIEHVCRSATKIVVAWGSKPKFSEEIASMTQCLSNFGVPIFCLGKNKDGSPKHSSRLAATAPLIPWV